MERDAFREGARLDQVQCDVWAGVREEPGALTDDHGADEQGHLVNQVVREQPLSQGAAAVYLQFAPRLGFQLTDSRREVTREDGCVRPLWVGERVRCYVLGPCIQGFDDGVRQVFFHAPVVGEEFIGPPTEQKRIAALVELADERQSLVVEERPCPSAASEMEQSAAAILIRPTISLHHSVNGDLRVGRQLHGFVLSLVVVFLLDDRAEARLCK